MARTLERRIGKLEKRFGMFPCDRPGHNDLFLFVCTNGEELPPEDQAKIDSIRACPRCKDKTVVFMMMFGREPTQRMKEHRPAEAPFEFSIGKPDAEPRVVPAPWLNGILTIGGD